MYWLVVELKATWAAFSRAERLALGWIAVVMAFAAIGARFEKGLFEGVIAGGALVLILVSIPYCIWQRGFRRFAVGFVVGMIGLFIYGFFHESSDDRFRREQAENILRAENHPKE